ncbi:MAG: AbgT family transporter [Phocaeicola sp.]
MKSKLRFIHPATLFFLLTLIVIFISWVASMQGVEEVRSLLTADALRWQLRNALPNYVKNPALGNVIILFIGGGLLFHSGWVATCKKLCVARTTITRKEWMGFFFSLLVGIMYVLFIVSITYAPFTLLRSVTGSIQSSPFLEGIYYLISVGIGIMGIVFGYTSGRMHNDYDIIAGMKLLFIQCADYFVSLFFLVQLFSSLDYSGFIYLLSIDIQFFNAIFTAAYYLLLLPLFYKKIFF